MRPAFALAYALPLPASAEYQRIPTGQGPELDGPGSFGALDGNVTLDCLTYVGSPDQGGTEYLLVRDERDTVHRLRTGDRMGENSGRISRIGKDAIHVTPHVQRDGKSS